MNQKTTGPGEARTAGPGTARAVAPSVTSTAGPVTARTAGPIDKREKTTAARAPEEIATLQQAAKPAPSKAFDYRAPGETKGGEYGLASQGPVINELTGMSTGGYGTNLQHDTIGDTATLTRAGVRLVLHKFTELGLSLKGTTHRLLTVLLTENTENKLSDGGIRLSFSEFMAKCKIKDRKAAAAQFRKDADTLMYSKLTWEDPLYHKTEGKSHLGLKPFLDVNPFEYIGLTRKGEIRARFTRTFQDILDHYPVMYYPKAAIGINLKANPNSQYFLWTILANKRKNITKKNECTLAVKTLLESSPEMPRYEDRKTWGGLKREIIDRFYRDMDALNFAFTWEYCRASGAPLTSEDLKKGVDEIYSEFIRLFVKITFRDNYPDQEELRQAKKERIVIASKAQNQKPKGKRTHIGG